MKVETLNKYLKQNESTKLFLSTEEYLVAGYVSNPRNDGSALRVDIGPYIIYSSASKQIIQGSVTFVGLHLDSGTRITRRMGTYRRYVKGRGCPEEFLQRAWEL